MLSMALFTGIDTWHLDSTMEAFFILNIVQYIFSRYVEALGKKVESDGIELVIQANEAEVIEENIDAIVQMALLGGLLAIIVLWIFPLKRVLMKFF